MTYDMLQSQFCYSYNSSKHHYCHSESYLTLLAADCHLPLQVTLYDHSSCTARVVGYDASKDIAVLKLALPRGRLVSMSVMLHVMIQHK
jgi:hypothetical protein